MAENDTKVPLPCAAAPHPEFGQEQANGATEACGAVHLVGSTRLAASPPC